MYYDSIQEFLEFSLYLFDAILCLNHDSIEVEAMSKHFAGRVLHS